MIPLPVVRFATKLPIPKRIIATTDLKKPTAVVYEYWRLTAPYL